MGLTGQLTKTSKTILGIKGRTAMSGQTRRFATRLARRSRQSRLQIAVLGKLALDRIVIMTAMANEEHFKLLFGVRRSVRYHSRRQAFYESVDRWTSFCLLLLGSGSVALAIEGSRAGSITVGLLVAVVSGLKLVFAFGLKASRHAQFVRDFTRLEEQLYEDDSEETVSAVTRERLAIEATEPPVMRVLDVVCHNELLRAMGNEDPKERVQLNWFQHLTANFFNFGERNLAKGA